ncbi:hypothetical protein MANES_07G002040v8 [Manihot esculenta]|uniref:Uncharacterized protein n=1 Tax=Manihot esculenta TaxID=3983 RepID=A0ACB7HCW1_MANES|nr:hypothetical protein MANES_07G002040v8 [Manihot esculenta]
MILSHLISIINISPLISLSEQPLPLIRSKVKRIQSVEDPLYGTYSPMIFQRG